MKRKSAGNNTALRHSMTRLGLLLFLIACCLPATMLAGKKSKEPRTPQEPAVAIIVGTVFRSTGLTLPGAEVTLTPVQEPGQSVKLKKVKVLTDARGEFAVRVPPVAAKYTVAAKAPGYQPQEKPATITGEDRLTVFFQLEAASK
jgi:hypothetical protein